MDKLIETYLKHKNSDSVKYEFELRFKHYLEPLTRSDYNNVIEWLLMCGFKIKQRVSLFRISLGKNIRAEIDGIDAIKQYCANQTSEHMKYVEKQQIAEPFTHQGYNVQFSLNSETVKPGVETMPDSNTFRFMKRIQLYHPDHPSFVIDCSIVKMLRNSPNKTMTKVFDMTPVYEIEAECLETLPMKELKGEIAFMITHVLKGLQRTNFPISYKEITAVQEEYKELFPVGDRLKDLNFIGPNTVTLQHENLPMLTEDDFMVTDKADGERKLLFISKKMKMYLIPTSGRVENMNCTLEPQKGLPIGPMVLDGEHVVKDSHNNMHNTFYAFDMYYLNIDPLTEQNRNNLSINTNDVRAYTLPVRREVLMRVINSVFTSITNLSESKYAIQYKQFLTFSPANCKMLYEMPKPYHKDGLIFTPIHYGVGVSSVDAPISNKRSTWDLNFKWKPAEENTIDFYVDIDPTPKKTITGKEYKVITLKSSYNAYPTREQSDYTVCPSVSVYQNFDIISNGKQRIPFIGGRPYDVTAYMCNMYTNEEGNVCTESDGRPVEVLEHGSIVEFKYDATREKGWRWTPIRVRWDKTDPNAYSTAVKNWISIHNPVTYQMLVAPMKESVTKSLRPVELDTEYYTLKTEKGNLKEGKLMSDFHNDIKRMMIDKISDKVRATTRRKAMLIDFACGKGGDLQKWEDAQAGFVLGIDINNDNLHNTIDGAFLRVVQKKNRKSKRKEKELLPIIFLEGSSSLLIKDGEALKHDYENRILQYLFGMESTYPPMLSEKTQIPYGFCKQGFDIGSIQFALHYMFDSEESIMKFIYNLIDCIQVGGYFCATCFDGTSMMELLKDIKKGQIMSTAHDDTGTFKLSTDVKKGYVPFSNIEKQYDNSDMKEKTHYVPLKIGVKQQSLNKDKFLEEFLVFAEYFIPLMAKHGFELATNFQDFPNGTGLFKTVQSKFKDMSSEPNQEAISHLNRYYIFQKQKHVSFRGTKVYETETNHYLKIKIS
jgi:hypothetical protein